MGKRTRIRRAGFGVGIAALMLWVGVAPAAAAKRQSPRLAISVLSGRADLVSGGSALVAITLPRRADARRITVKVGQRKVTGAFAFRRDGRFEALLTRLALGRNVVQATLRSGLGARIALVNHPAGGPVFSGPQLQPWACQPGAVDKQCDQPPTVKYMYMSTDALKRGFQPYDPSSPPSDVANTTTDQGVTVPFIVRAETGYMDRDQYQISALYQPGKPWTRWPPSRSSTTSC